LRTVEDEQRASQSVDAKMVELRAGAPDVAALVDDERLTLEAGIAELRTRQRMVEEAIDAGRRAAARFADLPVQLAMLEKGIALAGREMLAGINGAVPLRAAPRPRGIPAWAIRRRPGPIGPPVP
jgi:hypothetical protein